MCLSYFGPMASELDRRLVGPVQLLRCLNHSAKVAYSEVDRAVRQGRLTRNGLVVKRGVVDFSPEPALARRLAAIGARNRP